MTPRTMRTCRRCGVRFYGCADWCAACITAFFEYKPMKVKGGKHG